MKPKYKVWYHPYNAPDETEFVWSHAANEIDARFFARHFGEPFKVEAVTGDYPDSFFRR